MAGTGFPRLREVWPYAVLWGLMQAAEAQGDADCGMVHASDRTVSLSAVAHRLTLRLVDGSGQPAAGRVSVFAPGGAPLLPEDGDIPFYWAWTGHKFFYAADTVNVGVPQGAVRVLVGRGPEYRPFDKTFAVTADTTVTVPLLRAFDAPAHGWWSGDTHVHLNHGGEGSVYTVTPEKYLVMAQGEDLHVSCLLTNGAYYEGPGPHPAGDAEHLFHMAAEYRSALYGHMDILGTSKLPPYTGCCLPGDPATPLNADAVTWTHNHGGLAIYAHPLPTPEENFTVDSGDWPYSGLARELPATAILSGVDGFDILSYSGYDGNATRGLYFDFLNLRFPVPLSAGTDATADRYFSPPAGGYRVYVRCDSLGLAGWLDGLRAGRSFATNGPLVLDFDVEGARSGDVLERFTGNPLTVHASLKLFSRERVNTCDIYADGILLRRELLPAFTDTLEHAFTVTLSKGAGWIVARLSGPATSPVTIGTELVAYTSPIWVHWNGASPPRVPAAVAHFDGWIQDLETMVLSRVGWESDEQKVNVWTRLEGARAYFSAGITTSVPDGITAGAPEIRVWPNPFRAGVLRASVVAASGPLSVRVFDVRGRLVRMLHDGVIPISPAELTWDGRGDDGVFVPGGIYFLRAATADGVATARFLVLGP